MAATTPPPQWVFTQLNSGKQIILSGATAPHGRARKGTLLADGKKLRSAETYYDGSNSAPTRHIFGTKNNDIELHGRFMDRDLGPGGANAMAEKWKQWVVDAEMATLEWGDNIVLTFLLDEFVPEREDAANIAWKMTLRVSVDTTTPPVATLVRPTTSLVAPEFSYPSTGLPKLTNPIGFSLNLGFLDLIGDLVDDVQQFTGQFVNLANQLGSLEAATASQLSRLRASLGQMRTAVTILQQTIDAVPDDFALSSDSASSTVGWGQYRSQAVVNLLQMQAAAAQTDRQIALAQRGKSSTSTVAKDGDTWEQISTQMFGSPAKADLLRQSNGARYGKKPKTGAKIQVPLRT